MGERIHLPEVADVGGFLQRVLANGANVDVFNRGVSQLFGVVKCGQTIESIIGNFRNSDVRFARVCMGLRRKMRFGQNAKQ